ncbi:MAG: hypothetical protein ACK55I_18865, partial [bacterium]
DAVLRDVLPDVDRVEAVGVAEDRAGGVDRRAQRTAEAGAARGERGVVAVDREAFERHVRGGDRDHRAGRGVRRGAGVGVRGVARRRGHGGEVRRVVARVAAAAVRAADRLVDRARGARRALRAV